MRHLQPTAESNVIALPQARLPVIVVGAGPVGVRFTEELLKRNPGQPVYIFGDEPWQPYNRVKLSSLLAGEISVADIANIPRIEARNPLVQHLSVRIVSIDPDLKKVVDSEGQDYFYETLVLATGSRAHVPSVKGVHLKNVFTFRDLKDTEHLKARTARSRHVVVVGGGLLGLEAARALQQNHTLVTVVQQAPRLMNRQLDERGAELLRATLTGMKIETFIGQGVREITSQDGQTVGGVLLRSGEYIYCDTVLLCAGIQPNSELARRAWIPVSRGIRVNDQLQTGEPDIYAIGECAEHRGKTYGLVSPGYEQAAIAAEIIAQGADADHLPSYHGSADVTQLKVIGKTVFSMGEVADPDPRHGLMQVTYQSRDGSVYRKIVLYKHRLIGALAVGEWEAIPRLREALTHQRLVLPWQWLRFKLTGDLWGEGEQEVQQWQASAIVCQCNGVTKGALVAALENGCQTVPELKACTGAATTCGTCQPLVQSLVGGLAEKEASPGYRWLSGVSMVAMLVALLIAFLPAQTNALSVKDISLWEWLRTDALAKQVTGFSLLGLSLLALVVSMRKRVRWFRWGDFPWWRLVHAVIGLLCVGVLILHTGFSLGENLNRWLILDYLAILLVGSLVALFIAFEHRLSDRMARRTRQSGYWLHLLVAWPLPALLGAHVLSVYYF